MERFLPILLEIKGTSQVSTVYVSIVYCIFMHFHYTGCGCKQLFVRAVSFNKSMTPIQGDVINFIVMEVIHLLAGEPKTETLQGNLAPVFK